MSFLFKSSKNKHGAQAPPATRNTKPNDVPASNIPAPPNPAVSREAKPPPPAPAAAPVAAPAAAPAPAPAHAPAIAPPPPPVAQTAPVVPVTDGPNAQQAEKQVVAPGQEQRSMRETNEPEQPNRALYAPPRPVADPSPYPWSQRQLHFTLSNVNPFPRYGAAVNSVASKDGAIYIMGGLINGSTVTGDLWMVEGASPTPACFPVATTSEGPGPRVGHASLLVGNAFIVFGGDTKTEENDLLDDTLYLLNTSTKQWSRAAPAGPRPPGRYGHTLNILGSKIYIFGGQVEGFFFNDLVAFDLNALQQASNRWEILIQNSIDGGPPHGQIPPARTNHSMITYNDRLYLFGGTDGVNWFNDVWSYDPRTNSWTQLECIGYIPAAREGHASALVGDVMYIFGGRTEEGNDLGDLAAFRISSRRWYTFQNMGPSPSPRSGHSMTASGKHIVVLAGEPSTAPRNAGELSLAYYLDVSKIKYPADAPPQNAIDQRVPGQRRTSGAGQSGIPQSRALMSREQVQAAPGSPGRATANAPGSYQNNDAAYGGSRLPRVAGSGPMSPRLDSQQPNNGASAVGSPSMSSPSMRQPTRPLSPAAEPGPRAFSPSTENAPRSFHPSAESNVRPVDARNRALASPPPRTDRPANEQSVGSPNGYFDNAPRAAPVAYKPQTYQPQPAGDMGMREAGPLSPSMSQGARQQASIERFNQFPTANGQAESMVSPIEPRTAPHQTSVDQFGASATMSPIISELSSVPSPPITAATPVAIPEERFEPAPAMSADPSTTVTRGIESRQGQEREPPMDSGLGSSPALSQLTDTLAKELDQERSKNAWMMSELALARKAGYAPSTSTNPALDERAVDAVGDDDKPLIEALLKMRAELVKMQSSIDNQSLSTAARIAEVAKQRDAAINEAVFAKAKLAAQVGSSPQFDNVRAGTPDADRSTDLSRKLAAAIAAHGDLSRKVDSMSQEKDAEKQARHLAEETAVAAHKRASELDLDRQRQASELANLRAELHETQRTSREAGANCTEAVAAHKLLSVDKNELSTRLDSALAETSNHKSILVSLRDAVTASSDKATLLEQQLSQERSARADLDTKLSQERSARADLDIKLSQLTSQHEDRGVELETTTRRLRDTEELANKHAEEARTHRQAVLDGVGKVTDRSVDAQPASDERVAILKQQVESATALVRQNQAAADLASEKLRRAEERIAGLEAYQEQSSREGLNMRKQMQAALKEAKLLSEQKAELQQQVQSQLLETNAITVQHGALKDILTERGVIGVDRRQSRGVVSPSLQPRYGTPDLQRVRELEQQLEASLRSHDETKVHLEEVQDREGSTRTEYEEKLSALDNDHQAAVKYLRGTEKMLGKMKQELQRTKTQAAEYSKELETVRAKESTSRSGEASTEIEQERNSLRKEIESMRAELASTIAPLESRISSLQTNLSQREAHLSELHSSHQTTQSNLASLQTAHASSRADLERLHRDNSMLEERARDAENKVQLLLDQVESSVDNYRRQSQHLSNGTMGMSMGTSMSAMNGNASHRRGLSDSSYGTGVSHNANHPAFTGHNRGESLGGESVYSQNAPSELSDSTTGAPTSNGTLLHAPGGRTSMALDSLANELDALRTHWEETAHKNYRLSERYDLEKSPPATTAASVGSGVSAGSMATWRKGLELDDEDLGEGRRVSKLSPRKSAVRTGSRSRSVSPEKNGLPVLAE